eukprot:gene57613-biopygen47476
MREATRMNPLDLTEANTLWAYAKLAVEVTPDVQLLAALCEAARREATRMNPQEVANTLCAYAKLAVTPDAQLLAALCEAARREAPRMNPLEVANTLW